MMQGIIPAIICREIFGTFTGDNRDTQSDMFCALIWVTFAVVLLSVPHDRSMAKPITLCQTK